MDATASAPALAPDPPAGWTVVLPLKGGPAAKSRLGGPPGLAAALAADCLAAVRACPRVRRVLVVTADPATASWTAAAGAEVVPEHRAGSGPSAAAQDGLRAAQGPTAVLLGDLPALRPQDLAAALAAAEQVLGRPDGARTAAQAAQAGQAGHAAQPGQVLVPDAEGTGSVLLAALAPDRLTPAFGDGSAARHRQAGALTLDLDLPRLRRDVDTDRDLAEALALGCGPATLAVLAATGTAASTAAGAATGRADDRAADPAELG